MPEPLRLSTDDRAVLDVLIVGAGQAGLALGHHLASRNASFLLLDAGPEVGHSWRDRWHSLRLFSPAEYDALPGMPFPAPTGDYHPSKDDVADYLQAYTQRFRLRCG
ncbi:FAD-dependent oxidoreductase [Geodermatophilus dictyosporus]|uniref:FAD-dependent oxidoreductase n=1 Tax=Geodermatophilus dictyosporus TaxID=1523247 RepID=UPI00145C1BAC|nr:FAD-dependent oxidoreductase [Geodermatophilus dictyosporus]